VLYKIVELASSFSDLQKLTFFGCASRLRVPVFREVVSILGRYRSLRLLSGGVKVSVGVAVMPSSVVSSARVAS
jgi:hypothetical protein